MTRKQIGFRILVLSAIFVATVFAADYLALRVRMLHPTPTMPFETITRVRILAIPTKTGKYDYQRDAANPTETITCVHSLFPHFGDTPCLFLKPRFNQPIPIG